MCHALNIWNNLNNNKQQGISRDHIIEINVSYMYIIFQIIGAIKRKAENEIKVSFPGEVKIIFFRLLLVQASQAGFIFIIIFLIKGHIFFSWQWHINQVMGVVWSSDAYMRL